MGWLWLFFISFISYWAFLFGKYVADQKKVVLYSSIILCWIFLLLNVLLFNYPEYEYYFLKFDGYVYLREGIFWPLCLFFYSSTRSFITDSSRSAVRALLVFLFMILIYNYRWGLGIKDYSKLQGVVDNFGICHNSVSETQAVAAGVTLSKYYGIDVSEGWLASVSLTKPRGRVDLVALCWGIMSAFEGTECQVNIKKLDWSTLRKEKNPSLLFLRSNGIDPLSKYAVVCLKTTEEGVLLATPRRGISWVKREDFLSLWDSKGIFVDTPFYIVPGKTKIIWV